jgi:hypothetical protein
MVREAGYRMAVTVDPGLIRPRDRAETLHRSVVGGRDNLAMFEAKLMGRLDAPWGLPRVSILRRRTALSHGAPARGQSSAEEARGNEPIGRSR